MADTSVRFFLILFLHCSLFLPHSPVPSLFFSIFSPSQSLVWTNEDYRERQLNEPNKRVRTMRRVERRICWDLNGLTIQ